MRLVSKVFDYVILIMIIGNLPRAVVNLSTAGFGLEALYQLLYILAAVLVILDILIVARLIHISGLPGNRVRLCATIVVLTYAVFAVWYKVF